MKHMIKALAIVLALMLIGGAALAEVVTTANVWLRSGPGLNYDQVTSYKEGKSLTFLGETQMDDRPVLWYKVSDGKNTGWISSRYAELKNETLPEPNATEAPAAPVEAPVEATAEPAEAPAAFVEPEGDAEETEAPTVADGALDVGKLFADLVTPDKAGDADLVELSNYYLDDLVTAAKEIGLISYREVESEVPYQYYNDAVIVAGNQNVEHVEVFGAGYAVFGVRVGMSVGEAMACLNAAGLDYLPSMNGVSYEHPAGESAFYVDENGHDSCVNVFTDPQNMVVEIDWSTYTG